MSDTLYNIIISPVAILIRAPILLTSYLLRDIAQFLETIGDAMPGMRRPPKKKR